MLGVKLPTIQHNSIHLKFLHVFEHKVYSTKMMLYDSFYNKNSFNEIVNKKFNIMLIFKPNQ